MLRLLTTAARRFSARAQQAHAFNPKEHDLALHELLKVSVYDIKSLQKVLETMPQSTRENRGVILKLGQRMTESVRNQEGPLTEVEAFIRSLTALEKLLQKK